MEIEYIYVKQGISTTGQFETVGQNPPANDVLRDVLKRIANKEGERIAFSLFGEAANSPLVVNFVDPDTAESDAPRTIKSVKISFGGSSFKSVTIHHDYDPTTIEINTKYNKNTLEARAIALHAVLYEAKALGFDIDAICKNATEGMFDGGKPYRGGSANWVVPARDAISDVLADVNGTNLTI